MTIRGGILLGYLISVAIGFYFFLDWLVDDVKPRIRQTTEEVLVDASVLLAAMAQERMHTLGADSPGLVRDELKRAFASARSRRFEANIYGLTKREIDLDIYITDAKGIVVFDSKGQVEGQDFSLWNDVYLTLRGQYGARSSRLSPDDRVTSVLVVASPIYARDGSIAGVLSVRKPTTVANQFIADARHQIVQVGLVSAVAVVLMGLVGFVWLTQPIKNLTNYAKAVRDGKRARLPEVGHVRELRELGQAFEEMRVAVEGRDSVERHVQSLTHELKSPIAAIQGAAELLGEKSTGPEQRQKFLRNIDAETRRVTTLVERLLALTTLEQKRELPRRERVNVSALAETAAAAFASRLETRSIALLRDIDANCHVQGDAPLLDQAISNLLQNAAEFTPVGGSISLAVKRAARPENSIKLTVTDSGSGIPDYALERVFDRFYSLPRPESQRKSTGLGLALVREIIELHNGTITLVNRETNSPSDSSEMPDSSPGAASLGACATITLPSAK